MKLYALWFGALLLNVIVELRTQILDACQVYDVTRCMLFVQIQPGAATQVVVGHATPAAHK
jgi:hypothetical protein